MRRRPLAAATFSAEWLQLRESSDTSARNTAAARLGLAEHGRPGRRPDGTALRVIDLACGTGANLRWLAPRLGADQQWLVVDHDAALLRRWPAWLGGLAGRGASARGERGLLHWRGPGFQADILRHRLDLAESLEDLPWQAAELLTASALLDLVSTAWLHRLVALAAGARVALLMALNVDGRHHWSPGDADDSRVGALFEAHQRRDKGFGGPALGADAVPALATALRARRYRVHTARSDWVLDGGEGAQALALQVALIDGIARAAVEQAPAAACRVQAWRQRRQAMAARSVLRVGHRDLLARPPA